MSQTHVTAGQRSRRKGFKLKGKLNSLRKLPRRKRVAGKKKKEGPEGPRE